MRYLSLCSGIEAATVAWRSLGWEAVAFSEIEPFPCAILAHYYPDVPNLGDMTKIDGSKYCGAVDLIVGGTPCQDFSVAGKRAGMAGERGRLALYYLRLVDYVSPRWIVWENVPGVLSSNGGRDFALFVGTLAKLGYGWSYRVLDAQYFGVPQRRRRVFLVGHFGDWRPAAAVLFEPGSMCRNSAPRKKTREDVAGTIDASLERSRGAGTNPGAIISHWDGGPHPTLSQCGNGRGGIAMSDQELFAQGGSGLVWAPEIVQQAMSCKWSKGTSGPAGDEHHNLVGCISEEQNASTQEKYPSAILRILRQKVGEEAFTEWGLGILDSLQTPEILRQALHGSGIRRAARETGFILDDRPLSCSENLPSGPLRHLWEEGPDGCSSQGRQLAQQLAREFGKALPFLPPHNTPKTALRVRRLTPRETERLQGFPDDYTAIAYRGKPVADSPRYRALGNSMAVPVVRWIGQRIQQWEAAHV